jgi:hypothetical protein
MASASGPRVFLRLVIAGFEFFGRVPGNRNLVASDIVAWQAWRPGSQSILVLSGPKRVNHAINPPLRHVHVP